MARLAVVVERQAEGAAVLYISSQLRDAHEFGREPCQRVHIANGWHVVSPDGVAQRL